MQVPINCLCESFVQIEKQIIKLRSCMSLNFGWNVLNLVTEATKTTPKFESKPKILLLKNRIRGVKKQVQREKHETELLRQLVQLNVP